MTAYLAVININGRKDDQIEIIGKEKEYGRTISDKNDHKFIGFCFVHVLFVQKYMKIYRNKQGPKR